MEHKHILSTIAQNTGIINISRSQAGNIIDSLTLKEISNQIESWNNDKDIKVIIISGGETFSSGIDIKELAKNANRIESNFDNMQNSFSVISQCKKPIIAAVSGYVMGIGFELALACDFILASDDAKFAFPEISLNTIPCFGGIQRLTRTIGKAKTMEMVLTGKVMNSEEAEKYGIISRIVPFHDLMSDAARTAAKISLQSAKVLKIAKETINFALSGLESGIEIEKSNGELCFTDSEFKQVLLNLQKTQK